MAKSSAKIDLSARIAKQSKQSVKMKSKLSLWSRLKLKLLALKDMLKGIYNQRKRLFK